MYGRRLCAVPLALVLSYLPLGTASAQGTGFVHLRTHLVNDPPYTDRGVYHTFVQGKNGLEETSTLEFTPGQYTFASVDVFISGCRASATNVNFTIKAGQWTEVDVPVTFRDCTYGVGIEAFGGHNTGVGAVNVSILGNSGSIPVSSCGTAVDNQGHIVWSNFTAARGRRHTGSR